MAIAALAPQNGIVAQLGGESRPLVLRNGEIERFEARHGVGIFAMVKQLIEGDNLQARHMRDLVALGLVGGGMGDRAADTLVSEIPPYENLRLRSIAQDVVMAAFMPPKDSKKKDGVKAGSSRSTRRKATTPKSS